MEGTDSGSDSFINGSEILAGPISFLFKTFLIHSYIPVFLLICSLVPLVKDKLGEISSSDNYRAIAISSLMLKILDWIILLLFSDKLKTCDLQFGFQQDSSTQMCTWIVSEVISYYMRSGTSIFCCLLDLKKAFDKVEFAKLFEKMKQRNISGIFLRLLIFIYLHQSCRVQWNGIHSEEFKVMNGVRQGAILSPCLFSLYINSLLLQLEDSGFGCHVGNYYYGCAAYADDIVLLSPTRNGLQEMFSICEVYFLDHKISISTNPDITKSKTKCLYFSHNNDKKIPAPIMLGEMPLPWVDAWAHLGNELNTKDMSIPYKNSLDSDSQNKKRKFISKFHALRQEFGFLKSESLFNLIQIYATSFYGSNLWLFTSEGTEKIFTSWNTMIRTVWNLPNTTHCYFVEHISNAKHIKAVFYQRYLTFIQTLCKSEKKCLAALANLSCKDNGSLTKQNLNLISEDTGCENILDANPRFIASQTVYAEVPEEEKWRIAILKELLLVRDEDLEIGDDLLSSEELNDLINMICTT